MEQYLTKTTKNASASSLGRPMSGRAMRWSVKETATRQMVALISRSKKGLRTMATNAIHTPRWQPQSGTLTSPSRYAQV